MSLKVWLPLNGNLNNQGLADVTVTNNGATVNSAGKIGSCYAFNGSSSNYMSYSNFNASGLSEISVCCWVKPSNTNLSNLFGINYSGSTWQFTATSTNAIGVRDNSSGGASGTRYDYSFGIGVILKSRIICNHFDFIHFTLENGR